MTLGHDESTINIVMAIIIIIIIIIIITNCQVRSTHLETDCSFVVLIERLEHMMCVQTGICSRTVQTNFKQTAVRFCHSHM